MRKVVNQSSTRRGWNTQAGGTAVLGAMFLLSSLLSSCRCAPSSGGGSTLGPPPAVPRILGRSLQAADGSTHFAWSDTTILARFTGTSLALKLEDVVPGPHGNLYNVLVDDRPPLVLNMMPGVHEYPVAHDLEEGEHSLTVIKRTEALVGEARFAGLVLSPQGKILPPPPAKARRIEIIGDSISAGYGNEGANEKCGFSPTDENGDLAYGPMAARALDAEVTVIAWSGKGVLRNLDGNTTDTVPALYGRILPEKPNSAWDFARWVPDAVVINLGTNDFGLGVPDSSAFANAYDALLKSIRKHYPQATLLCAVGPMLSDTHPKDQTQLSAARTYVQAAVQRRQKTGDTRVGFLEFPVQTGHRGYGCDWHPSLATHAAMAAQLTAVLREALGW